MPAIKLLVSKIW